MNKTFLLLLFYILDFKVFAQTITLSFNMAPFNHPLIPIVSISNNGIVCQGDAVLINTSSNIDLTYQWQNNGSDIGGATDSTYSINTSGSYSVVVTNTNGCSATSAATIVTVNPVPSAPTATTSYTYCQNQTVPALSATGSNLLWYSSSTGGSGSAVATIPSTAAPGSTSYYVSQTVNGCESPRTQINVTIIPAPNAFAGNDVTVCQGQSLTLTATGGNSYTWNNGVTQGVPFIPSGTATYTVTVSNGLCTATDDILVTIAAPPSSAGIYQVGNDLYSTVSTGNQWYNSQGLISGANAQSYTPTVSGNYFVIVTDANGCVSDTSNVLYVTVTGLNNNASSQALTLHPNPTSNFLTISYGGYNSRNNYQLQVYSAEGKLVLVSVLKNKTMSFDVSQYTSGIYYLKLIGEDGVFVRKFVVEN